MSQQFFGALIFLVGSSVSWAAGPPSSCDDKAHSQTDLNTCASAAFKRADDQLNAVYQTVLKRHQADTGFVHKLQAAQRAWLLWRDAEMEASYPDRADPAAYGSVFPMCWNAKLAALTEARTRQLSQWLEGVPEGEVCAGSLPKHP